MASNDALEDDLDDILDSALDDFAKVSAPQAASSAAGPTSSESGSKSSDSLPRQAECDVPVSSGGSQSRPDDTGEVKGLGMPALSKKKKGKGKKPALQSSTAQATGASGAGASKTAGSSGSRQPKPLNATLEQLAAQTRQTVEGIRGPEASAAGPSGRGDGGGLEGISGDDEEMMEKLMKQFEEMGTGDIQGLMDTMLQQLLSKEVLHEPMVEIKNRYPDWLSANSAKLSPEDLRRYTRQYECIQRLCQLYDSGTNDFTEILGVMKEMQECGQPPAEIIQDLAPGLEIGEDGLPVIPDLASGDLPPNCSVM